MEVRCQLHVQVCRPPPYSMNNGLLLNCPISSAMGWVQNFRRSTYNAEDWKCLMKRTCLQHHPQALLRAHLMGMDKIWYRKSAVSINSSNSLSKMIWSPSFATEHVNINMQKITWLPLAEHWSGAWGVQHNRGVFENKVLETVFRPEEEKATGGQTKSQQTEHQVWLA